MKPGARALLINPYIYDYSAYNFWSAPLGLLYIGSILRKNGIEIDLIDCMEVVEKKRKQDGRAPFVKEKVNTPDILTGIRKRLRRYGISQTEFLQRLSAVDPPDFVLVTGIMTYWYMGTKEVVAIVKQMFPDTKIVVGGLYPSLCREHALANMNGADLVVENNRIDEFYDYVESVLGTALQYKPMPFRLGTLPYPCFDLYEEIPFIPLMTSCGCVYRCAYCATSYLYPRMKKRPVDGVLDEIRHWHDFGVKRYVFYDDGLLHGAATHAVPLLKGISGLPFEIDIYNPNALNAAMINDETSALLLDAGFREARIGLETVDPLLQKSTGGKVDKRRFEDAVRSLVNAGFEKNMIGVYILAGLPVQRWEDVRDTIDYLSGFGVRIHLAEYTPIPHTVMFEKYYRLARYPIHDEPLFQNNALFPFAWEGFTEKDLELLKRRAHERSG